MFEKWLTELAIHYLLDKGKSVMINYEVTGGVSQQRTDEAYTYGCVLNDVDLRMSNGKSIVLPEGQYVLNMYHKQDEG